MKQQVEIVWHIDDLKGVLQDNDLGVKDDFLRMKSYTRYLYKLNVTMMLV